MTRTRLLLAACGSSGSRPGTSGSADDATAAAAGSPDGTAASCTVAQHTLAALTVASGTTVQVLDRDDEAHAVTADGGSFPHGTNTVL